jgi:hypothetical protein
VTQAYEGLREAEREAEGELRAARRALRVALVHAHEVGASYSLLARLLGVRRQRISQIVGGKG